MTSEYRPRGRRAADIAADVEAAAAAGRAPGGSLLPPVRALAAELGVAPGTVAAAYRLLAERGVVEGHRRAGTRIRHSPAAAAVRRAVAPPPGTKDLWSGNPDPTLLPELGPALAAAAPRRRQYGGPAVLPALARFGAEAFAADGVVLPACTVTGGALDAIERTLQAHLHPGTRVAVEDPGYAGVLDLVAALGLVAEPVAIDEEGMVPSALRAALVRGARAVIVTPRAHNPTGAALTDERAAALAGVVAAHGRPVVIEDDHAGMVAGTPPVSLVGEGPGVVVRSASKALGPDLRVALVAGDRGTVAAIEARQAVGQGWVSHLLQELVLALLEDPTTPARLASAAAAYRARRDALVEALAAHGLRATARSGLNVWVPVPEEAGVVAGMAARGWGVAGGARYRIASAPGVRVTTATLAADEAGAVATALAASIGPPGHTRSG